MKSQAKVKFLILLAILILIAMFVLVGFQLVKITQAQNKIASQQEQISTLQQQLDFYNNKTPDENHETITGEN